MLARLFGKFSHHYRHFEMETPNFVCLRERITLVWTLFCSNLFVDEKYFIYKKKALPCKLNELMNKQQMLINKLDEIGERLSISSN